MEHLSNGVLEVKDVPDIGRGVFAVRDIEPYDVMTIEPVLTAAKILKSGFAIDMLALSSRLFEPSTLTDLSWFVDDAHRTGIQELLPRSSVETAGRVATNAFTAVSGDLNYTICLGRWSSMFNHSCRPNSIVIPRFIEGKGVCIVSISTTRIPAGSEIRFAYQACVNLPQTYGFTCGCGAEYEHDVFCESVPGRAVDDSDVELEIPCSLELEFALENIVLERMEAGLPLIRIKDVIEVDGIFCVESTRPHVLMLMEHGARADRVVAGARILLVLSAQGIPIDDGRGKQMMAFVIEYITGATSRTKLLELPIVSAKLQRPAARERVYPVGPRRVRRALRVANK